MPRKCLLWQTVRPSSMLPNEQVAKAAMRLLTWSPASIKKGFLLWKHDMGVGHPSVTRQSSVNGFCESFAGLLIADRMALPPGRWSPFNEPCVALQMACLM